MTYNLPDFTLTQYNQSDFPPLTTKEIRRSFKEKDEPAVVPPGLEPRLKFNTFVLTNYTIGQYITASSVTASIKARARYLL